MEKAQELTNEARRNVEILTSEFGFSQRLLQVTLSFSSFSDSLALSCFVSNIQNTDPSLLFVFSPLLRNVSDPFLDSTD
jgi:hypothetical protein